MNRIASFSRILQFFSLAVLTQLTLMASQLVLLPIQIHLWGDSATASWYAAIAVANITTIADCGMRLAGHAELLRSLRESPADNTSTEHFRQVWAWIRMLVLAVTATLLVGDAIYCLVFQGTAYPLWRGALVVACALETILIVRIMYLDSLGLYRGAEASYFIFATLRLALSFVGLIVFRMQATGLAWLFLASSVVAVLWQARVCARAGTLGLFEKLPRKLSFRVLALARHTLAEPCANWVRLSLPVLMLTALAPAEAVTTYVALRAVFGVARSTVQQLARVASVEYLRIRALGRDYKAECILGTFVLVSVALGTALAAGVVADNLRILSLWLRHFDRRTFQSVVASFAAGAPFYGYQIILSLMFRVGQLGSVARRLYAFVLYSGLFAAVSLAFGSFHFYLVLVAVSEILLSASFMWPALRVEERKVQAGYRGFETACLGSLLVLVLWSALMWSSANIFADVSMTSVGWALACLVIILGVLAVFAFLRNADILRTALRPSTHSPDADPQLVAILFENTIAQSEAP